MPQIGGKTCGTKHFGREQYETTNLPSESDKLIFNPQVSEEQTCIFAQTLV
jgi:hypothetical protein